MSRRSLKTFERLIFSSLDNPVGIVLDSWERYKMFKKKKTVNPNVAPVETYWKYINKKSSYVNVPKYFLLGSN